MKRPLFLVALLYVAGVVLGMLPAPLEVLFKVAFAIAGLALVWARARPVLLCVLVVLAGWINLAHRTAVLSPIDLRVLRVDLTRTITIRGVLRETPSHRVHYDLQHGSNLWSSTAEIDVTAIRTDLEDWQPAFGRIVASAAGVLPATIFAGETIEITGILRPVRGPVAEGLFDYKNYLRQKGIYFQLVQTGEWQVVSPPRSPPLADRFSAWARKQLARGMPVQDQSLELEWALTLGWKAAMTDELAEPFIRAATYHIFAVDGLRIAIITGILFALFRAVGVPRVACGMAALPFILFYAALTGWPASAIRAIVMISVVFCGWVLNRPSDLLNSLYAAAIIILVWEPRQLFQAGFQLSFFVVLCIILIFPFFKQLGERLVRPDPLLPQHLQPGWRGKLRSGGVWTLELLLTSTAAWLGSIPLVAWYFHIITPLSGPANVPAIPLCSLVLICNLTSLLLAFPLPFASVLFNHAGWLCMEAIRVTSNWSANWPGAFYYVPMPSLFTIGIYYLALITIFTGWLFKGEWRKWKIAGLTLLLAVWCGNWFWQRSDGQVTIVPLEGGHAVFANLRGSGNDWLIDCGNTNAVDGVIKPFLRAQGVNRLSHFVVTHGESGFNGGAAVVEDLFHPRNIYAGATRSSSLTYTRFLATNRNDPEMQEPLRSGQTNGPWTVLYPGPENRFTRGEDNALVLRGQIGGTRILLMSDLSHAGQNALLDHVTNANELRAEIVVAGVPSENEPLSDVLLDAVQPRVIVVADSEYPAIRHATEKLKERLALRKVPTIYTRDSFAVTLTVRGTNWIVRAMDGTEVKGTTVVEAGAARGAK